MPVTKNSTKVVTEEVRLSYAHLFEAWSNDPEIPAKFSATLLIPKSSKKTMAAIKAAIDAATIAGKSRFGDSWGKKGVKTTLHDGDTEADLETNPEYEGHYYMSVSSNTQPGIVDRAVNPILDSSEVYSGCFVRVSINAFPYNAKGNQGVSFGLNHVQKLRDGDYLGGRSRASDDFNALEDEDDDGVL